MASKGFQLLIIRLNKYDDFAQGVYSYFKINYFRLFCYDYLDTKNHAIPKLFYATIYSRKLTTLMTKTCFNKYIMVQTVTVEK